MPRSKRWPFTSALTSLLLCSGASCAKWTTKPDAELPTDAVCRAPSAAESRSLQALVRDALPTDAEGRQLDLSPGDPLPEGARPALRPDLFSAAAWTTGMFCRCYPERCKAAQEPAERAPDPE